jgi:hypothetical protein
MRETLARAGRPVKRVPGRKFSQGTQASFMCVRYKKEEQGEDTVWQGRELWIVIKDHRIPARYSPLVSWQRGVEKRCEGRSLACAMVGVEKQESRALSRLNSRSSTLIQAHCCMRTLSWWYAPNPKAGHTTVTQLCRLLSPSRSVPSTCNSLYSNSARRPHEPPSWFRVA